MKFFDLHCDTITEMAQRKEGLDKNTLAVNLEEAQRYRQWTQVFAVFVPDELYGTGKGFSYFCNHVTLLEQEAKKHGDNIIFVTDKQGYIRGKEQGKHLALLSMESGTGLNGNLENINKVKAMGCQMITLTWNGENELGYGPNYNKGLKEFGKQAIQEMERCGVLVDVSHVNDVAFEEIMELTKKPVLATHSNARTICDHKRNLTDAQFKQIIKRKGIVGLNFYDRFLGDPATLEKAEAHLAHFLSLGGEDYVAIGADLDGARVIEPLNSLGKMGHFYEYLLKNNYKEALIKKVFYENADTFLQQNI